YAEYPPQGGKPAARHDDLMVIYADGQGALRADYHDSEGHAIRYAGSVSPGGEIVFASDPLPNAPRFRLTYVVGSGPLLQGRFEIAPPGKPDSFAPYLQWTARRVSAAP